MRANAIIFLCLCICGCVSVWGKPYQYYDEFVQTATGYDYHSYRILIHSEPPGAKIEWDKEYIGETPKEITYHGHFDLSAKLIVRAYPSVAGQFIQTKVISGHNIIPRTIFFDMYSNPSPPEYDWTLQEQACPDYLDRECFGDVTDVTK